MLQKSLNSLSAGDLVKLKFTNYYGVITNDKLMDRDGSPLYEVIWQNFNCFEESKEPSQQQLSNHQKGDFPPAQEKDYLKTEEDMFQQTMKEIQKNVFKQHHTRESLLLIHKYSLDNKNVDLLKN